VLTNALTIATSKVVPDTAGFPHGSPGLADVIDPVTDIEEVAINHPHKRKAVAVCSTRVIFSPGEVKGS